MKKDGRWLQETRRRSSRRLARLLAGVFHAKRTTQTEASRLPFPPCDRRSPPDETAERKTVVSVERPPEVQDTRKNSGVSTND